MFFKRTLTFTQFTKYIQCFLYFFQLSKSKAVFHASSWSLFHVMCPISREKRSYFGFLDFIFYAAIKNIIPSALPIFHSSSQTYLFELLMLYSSISLIHHFQSKKDSFYRNWSNVRINSISWINMYFYDVHSPHWQLDIECGATNSLYCICLYNEMRAVFIPKTIKIEICQSLVTRRIYYLTAPWRAAAYKKMWAW